MMTAVPYPTAAEPTEPVRSIRAVSMLPDRIRSPEWERIRVREPGKASKVVLPTMDGLCFEKVKHIAYLEAGGNYTLLHFLDGRQLLVCRTLREVEGMLPPAAFVRIHRSHTIHLRHIKKYIRGKGGHVVLQNSATLTVSAGQKDSFLDALKQYFNHWENP
ncbi:MAG: LytTR family transcriptional regulator [Lewinellaceae bacterium]|nr:LytTR family transcriptional regulator [Lewinellaceae bacterium]